MFRGFCAIFVWQICENCIVVSSLFWQIYEHSSFSNAFFHVFYLFFGKFMNMFFSFSNVCSCFFGKFLIFFANLWIFLHF